MWRTKCKSVANLYSVAEVQYQQFFNRIFKRFLTMIKFIKVGCTHETHYEIGPSQFKLLIYIAYMFIC